MKKFEEEMKEWFGSPTGFNMEFQSGYEAYCALIKRFKDWVSPEDHQNTVASNKAYEKSNRTLSEENAKFVVENIELQKQIAELKSQLKKQKPEIPEVPQFVANWYEKVSPIFLEGCIFDFILSNPQRGASASSEFEKWFMENNNSIEILIDMKRLGYTVKEKRFYLKDNRELESVGNTCIGYVTLYLKNDGYLTTDKTRAGKFTQSEIDSMAAESYEKIEVQE
jgi:hypothetical protein